MSTLIFVPKLQINSISMSCYHAAQETGLTPTRCGICCRISHPAAFASMIFDGLRILGRGLGHVSMMSHPTKKRKNRTKQIYMGGSRGKFFGEGGLKTVLGSIFGREG
jgi:hypothetical protein